VLGFTPTLGQSRGATNNPFFFQNILFFKIKRATFFLEIGEDLNIDD
jgi:hypothetical protein